MVSNKNLTPNNPQYTGKSITKNSKPSKKAIKFSGDKQNNTKKISSKISKNHKSNKALKDFKIHHLNCRSASGKQEEIFQYIEENDPDILVLSETWWDESVLKSVFEPNNYSLIRKDRCENYKKKYGKEGMGGGVAILYKSWLKLEVLKPVKEELEEILWVYVKGKTNFIVGVVYITDYCEILNEKSGESILEKHIKEINTYNCGSFLLGDFNIDLLNAKNNV